MPEHKAGQVEVQRHENGVLVSRLGFTPSGDRNELMSLEEAWSLYPELMTELSFALAGD